MRILIDTNVVTDSIGYRIDSNGSQTQLFYGEMKIDAADHYHIIPRTRPN
jgi:hypothetical protein